MKTYQVIINTRKGLAWIEEEVLAVNKHSNMSTKTLIYYYTNGMFRIYWINSFESSKVKPRCAKNYRIWSTI